MDTKEIVRLLMAGKKDEAKKMLVEYLDSAKVTSEERGAFYAQLVDLFSTTQGDVMAKYENFLEQINSELKEVNAEQQKLGL